MLERDPHTINMGIVTGVWEKLGIQLSTKDISRIRNEMQLTQRHMLVRKALLEVAGMVKISPQSSEYNLEDLALLLTIDCVRNTVIETYHGGISPSTETGDYSDVKVVTPYGEIPWQEVSRLNNDEMKAFNIEVSNKLYTLLRFLFDPKYKEERDLFLNNFHVQSSIPKDWNKPILDQGIMNVVKKLKKQKVSCKF